MSKRIDKYEQMEEDSRRQFTAEVVTLYAKAVLYAATAVAIIVLAVKL